MPIIYFNTIFILTAAIKSSQTILPSWMSRISYLRFLYKSSQLLLNWQTTSLEQIVTQPISEINDAKTYPYYTTCTD